MLSRYYASDFACHVQLCTAQDIGGEGRCTREQYVLAMLLKLGKSDQDEIDELEEQFDTLDKNHDGVLTHADLSAAEQAEYERGADLQAMSIRDLGEGGKLHTVPELPPTPNQNASPAQNLASTSDANSARATAAMEYMHARRELDAAAARIARLEDAQAAADNDIRASQRVLLSKRAEQLQRQIGSKRTPGKSRRTRRSQMP